MDALLREYQELYAKLQRLETQFAPRQVSLQELLDDIPVPDRSVLKKLRRKAAEKKAEPLPQLVVDKPARRRRKKASPTVTAAVERPTSPAPSAKPEEHEEEIVAAEGLNRRLRRQEMRQVSESDLQYPTPVTDLSLADLERIFGDLGYKFTDKVDADPIRWPEDIASASLGRLLWRVVRCFTANPSVQESAYTMAYFHDIETNVKYDTLPIFLDGWTKLHAVCIICINEPLPAITVRMAGCINLNRVKDIAAGEAIRILTKAMAIETGHADVRQPWKTNHVTSFNFEQLQDRLKIPLVFKTYQVIETGQKAFSLSAGRHLLCTFYRKESTAKQHRYMSYENMRDMCAQVMVRFWRRFHAAFSLHSFTLSRCVYGRTQCSLKRRGIASGRFQRMPV